MGRLRRHLLLAGQGQRRAGEPAGDVGEAEQALLRRRSRSSRACKFTHAWGGAIDTCSRFCVFWGQAMQGRVAYALGLHRARRRLDPLRRRGDARPARRQAHRGPRRPTSSRSKPLPFPPEPFRFVGIQATRWSLNREDRTGKRNAWLRTLDRMGLGFDS